jgi:hypothetical protein
VDSRDFESIPLIFSEEEIEELQTAIDKRKSRRRLARKEERSLKPAEQLDNSPNRIEVEVFSAVHLQHPA